MNIVSRFLPFIVCTQSHTGASSCLSLGAGSGFLIRRGSAPFWCGGSPRSWGCGGDKPRDILSTQPGSSGPNPKISGKVRITNRRFRKISGSAVEDSQEKAGSRPGIFPKRSTPPPYLQKNWSPPTPHRPVRKKIDRSDRFQNRSGRPLLFQYYNVCFHWNFRRDGMVGPIILKTDRSGQFQK